MSINTVITDTAPAAPHPRTAPLTSPTRWVRIGTNQAVPVIIATVLLFIIAFIAVPASLTGASILAMIVPAGIMAVAATGQTLVVQQKGIDLSAAGAITLAAIVVTISSIKLGAPLWIAILLALGATAVGGFVNGLLVAKLGITPIVATLASNTLLVGAVWTISRGQTNTPPQELRDFAGGSIGPVPNVVVVAIVAVAVVGIFMSRSVIARRFVGVGANPRAARVSGVIVNRHLIGAYVFSGVLGGIAGILLVGYLGSASLTLGVSYQLPVISAVVVGGAALSGGRGSVVATAIACVFLSQIVQVVLSLGAPTSTQLLVQSVALAVAAALRLVPWSSLRRRTVARAK